MKRITPEMALEAYRVTGLKPIQSRFYNNKGCACAIGAINAAKGNDLYESTARKFARDEFGFQYSVGFQSGFDEFFESGMNPDYNRGYEDGLAAWEAVKHLAEESP